MSLYHERVEYIFQASHIHPPFTGVLLCLVCSGYEFQNSPGTALNVFRWAESVILVISIWYTLSNLKWRGLYSIKFFGGQGDFLNPFSFIGLENLSIRQVPILIIQIVLENQLYKQSMFSSSKNRLYYWMVLELVQNFFVINLDQVFSIILILLVCYV